MIKISSTTIDKCLKLSKVTSLSISRSTINNYTISINYQAQPKPKSTHPDKFKFGIEQHNSPKQSCLPSLVGPINAYGSILSSTKTKLY